MPPRLPISCSTASFLFEPPSFKRPLIPSPTQQPPSSPTPKPFTFIIKRESETPEQRDVWYECHSRIRIHYTNPIIVIDSNELPSDTSLRVVKNEAEIKDVGCAVILPSTVMLERKQKFDFSKPTSFWDNDYAGARIVNASIEHSVESSLFGDVHRYMRRHGIMNGMPLAKYKRVKKRHSVGIVSY